MPAGSPVPHSETAAPARRGTPPRALWMAGATLTLVSLLCLLGALAAYFARLDWSFLPVLYAVCLWVLPLGFALLVAHVVWAAVARARA